MFLIDKYTQVPRLLAPVVACIDGVDALAADAAGLGAYVATFGGPERLKKLILADFFRHAFDGSGADSFFDAGSCIDGRLTSAWNWCEKIATKPYYQVFKARVFLVLCSFDSAAVRFSLPPSPPSAADGVHHV